MRLIFCGSGAFAVPTYRALLGGSHEVQAVITQPARPAGRGGKLRATPVAQAALEAGQHPIECPDINAPDFVERLREFRADVLCVAAFGQFIRLAARQAVAVDAINLHGSILPELRGAAPVNWAIIRGYHKTGVTTFSLVDAMDAGPVYLTDETDILPAETAGELTERLAEIGAGTMCRTLDLLAGGAEPVPQDESRATRAPLLKKSDGAIDWSADAEKICDLVRGTYPWPGAHAIYRHRNGQENEVTIARAVPAPDDAAGPPGTLDDDLFVAAGRGRVEILEIKPAGKRLMGWRDFVNGYRLAAGQILLAGRT